MQRKAPRRAAPRKVTTKAAKPLDDGDRLREAERRAGHAELAVKRTRADLFIELTKNRGNYQKAWQTINLDEDIQAAENEAVDANAALAELRFRLGITYSGLGRYATPPQTTRSKK